jgi:hypothetical protein
MGTSSAGAVVNFQRSGGSFVPAKILAPSERRHPGKKVQLNLDDFVLPLLNETDVVQLDGETPSLADTLLQCLKDAC